MIAKIPLLNTIQDESQKTLLSITHENLPGNIQEIQQAIIGCTLQKKSESPFASLPLEVRIRIYTFLPLHDLLNISITAKQFRQELLLTLKCHESALQTLIYHTSGVLEKASPFFQNIIKEIGNTEIPIELHIPNALSSKAFQKFICVFNNVTKISCNASFLKDTDISFLRKFSSLQFLDLHEENSLTDNAFEKIDTVWKNLKSIRIHNSRISDKSMNALLKISSLKIVHIFDCIFVKGTSEGLNSISKRWPDLFSLSFGGSLSTTHEMVRGLFGCVQLTQLNISNSEHITDDTLEGIDRELPQLALLNVSSTSITDRGLEYIKKCRELTHLNIRCCPYIQGMAWKEFGEYLPSLQNLNIELLFITDDHFKQIISCSSLREIHANGCGNLTSEAFIGIEKKLPYLEKLFIADLKNLKDDGIESIAKCPSLSLLYLAGCNKLSSKSISKISFMKKLLILDISSTLFTREDILYLARCTRLEELHMSSCEHLSDEDFIGFSSIFKNLKVLRLNSTRIGKHAMEEIRKCKNLEILDIRLCRNLEDTYFDDIHKDLISLKSVHLSDAHVTQHAVTALKMCPKLQEIEWEDEEDEY